MDKLQRNKYRKMGFRVALDDFRTGYSGLARLAEMRPDIIKVDRALVQGCHLDLQLEALRAAGADPIFSDQVSGMRTKRPGLGKALAALKAGDTLAVWKLDRLCRSLPHLVAEVAGLKERGFGFKSLTESIDTGTPHGRLLFGLFGTLAEFERDLTKEGSGEQRNGKPM